MKSIFLNRIVNIFFIYFSTFYRAINNCISFKQKCWNFNSILSKVITKLILIAAKFRVKLLPFLRVTLKVNSRPKRFPPNDYKNPFRYVTHRNECRLARKTEMLQSRISVLSGKHRKRGPETLNCNCPDDHKQRDAVDYTGPWRAHRIKQLNNILYK